MYNKLEILVYSCSLGNKQLPLTRDIHIASESGNDPQVKSLIIFYSTWNIVLETNAKTKTKTFRKQTNIASENICAKNLTIYIQHESTMSKYLTEQLKVNLKFFSEFRPVIPSHFPRILHYSTLIYQKNRVKLDHNRWQTKELMKLRTRLVRVFVL